MKLLAILVMGAFAFATLQSYAAPKKRGPASISTQCKKFVEDKAEEYVSGFNGSPKAVAGEPAAGEGDDFHVPVHARYASGKSATFMIDVGVIFSGTDCKWDGNPLTKIDPNE